MRLITRKSAPVVLLLMALLSASILMTACSSDPEVVEKIVEVEVPVEVEKIVEKSVEVVKEVKVEVPVEVEKIVEKEIEKIVKEIVEVEVEVEKIVEKEKIVEVLIEVPVPEGPKREIVFGGLNWDSALVQNGIARYIVEHGYGHETSQIEGATVPLFQGLRKGDIDITMEIWLPNQNVVWNEAVKAGEVIPVGKSLEDNWQSTFLIPAYVQAANPDLDSVEDLKEEQYKSLFAESDSGGKAVLYG